MLLVGLGLAMAPVGGTPSEVRRVGAGSYALVRAPGAQGPPPPVRLGPGLAAPLPTSRFWSSLVTGERPRPHHPHPLSVHPSPRGLRVRAPGDAIAVGPLGFGAGLDEERGEDLTLTSAAVTGPLEARLLGHGDWTVRVGLRGQGGGLEVSYGHGLPWVHALVDGGARVTFPEPPRLWSGGPDQPALGLTVHGRPYGLFGPTGSRWEGLDGLVWTNRPPAGARHFTAALLPAATPEALALFARHAHVHVVGSRVSWSYDPATSRCPTTFELETRALEGTETDTLLALYPHQWSRSDAALLPGLEYASVRGPLRLVRGKAVRTAPVYPGLLPALPPGGEVDPARRRALLQDELARAKSPPLDAYREAKLLGRLAVQVPLAEEEGPDAARALVAAIERRLERRFTALDGRGHLKADDRLEYEPTWGALLVRPAAFGSDTALADHHFHAGYVLRAAAEVARLDPGWLADERWGGVVRLLARDVASPDRQDPLFPFLRCFDPYAGHSWASGLVDAVDGPNQESSSEALNCWSALVLLGQATGDRPLRDLGAWLYATELSAVEEYWFDVERRTFPAGYAHPVVSMVWGSKSVLETWFSTEPEHLYGINWLPLTAASLYLGRHPAVAARSYEALRARRPDGWRHWPDLVAMYRALSDPEDAARQLEALGPDAPPEEGNSRLILERWVGALRALGQVDRSVTADCPLFAVFVKDGVRTHVAWRMPNEPPFTATFSNGVKVRCDAVGLTAR